VIEQTFDCDVLAADPRSIVTGVLAPSEQTS
jgi:hypothetical protein